MRTLAILPAAAAALQEPATQAHGAEENGVDLGNVLAHHILDASEYDIPFLGPIHLPQWLQPFHLGGAEIDLNLSKHVVLLLVAALITAVLSIYAARAIARQGSARAPSGLAGAMEALVVFLRDDVVKPAIGHGSERFTPLILTFFLFILTMNLLGLVPGGGSATGNIAVTATLAIITFLVTEIGGFLKLGPAAYMRTIFFAPPGVSGVTKYALMAVLTPVELLGKFTKPFALAMRLFANMTAGHMLIFSVLGFILLAGQLVVTRWLVAAGASLFVVAILVLELLIAIIQAYIFAMLSASFIGLMQHEH